MERWKRPSGNNKRDSSGVIRLSRKRVRCMLSSGTGTSDEYFRAYAGADPLRYCRVVLDEAHNIKERSTNAAKAAFALDASYRWCLSGTPLQNRVGELYSLVRFLGGDRKLCRRQARKSDRLTFACFFSLCVLLLQEVSLQIASLAIRQQAEL